MSRERVEDSHRCSASYDSDCDVFQEFGFQVPFDAFERDDAVLVRPSWHRDAYSSTGVARYEIR